MRKRALFIWLITGCVLIYCMIMIGGITRLTHSGLSITNWEFFHGAIPPVTEDQWNKVFDRYKQTPEFTQLHNTYTLSDFKSIFWWEYIHRLLGRIIGMVFIIPLFYFLIRKMIDRSMFIKLIVIFGLGILQGFFGWYMVKSGLVHEPRVSHYRLALHLITALITYSFTLWVALSLHYNKSRAGGEIKYQKWISMLIGMVFLQMLYGAFVAGLRAGHIHNTFPLMDGKIISPAAWGAEPIWINFIENPSMVQFIHRCLAWFILLVVLALWFDQRKTKLDLHQMKAFNALVFIVIVQFCLGVLALLFHVPVILGVLHQGAGILLLTTLIVLLKTLRTAYTPFIRDHP